MTKDKALDFLAEYSVAMKEAKGLGDKGRVQLKYAERLATNDGSASVMQRLSDAIDEKQKINDEGYAEGEHRAWDFNNRQLSALKYARGFLEDAG